MDHSFAFSTRRILKTNSLAKTVWHDPTHDSTSQQRMIQLIDVILQLCFSKSSTRGGKKNNIVFDYESRILFFFFTFQWTDKLTEIFFLIAGNICIYIHIRDCHILKTSSKRVARFLLSREEGRGKGKKKMVSAFWRTNASVSKLRNPVPGEGKKR